MIGFWIKLSCKFHVYFITASRLVEGSALKNKYDSLLYYSKLQRDTSLDQGCWNPDFN